MLISFIILRVKFIAYSYQTGSRNKLKEIVTYGKRYPYNDTKMF
jgi:hypothetical protein